MKYLNACYPTLLAGFLKGQWIVLVTPEYEVIGNNKRHPSDKLIGNNKRPH